MTASLTAILRIGLATLVMTGSMAGAETAEEGSMSNLSIRGRVQTGIPLVASFTIPPGAAKTVLVRVAGPALAVLGVGETLIDPMLELYDGHGAKLRENDDFLEADAVVAASVGAFPFPAGSKDAMLIASLPPGTYTVQARGVSGTTGEALVEIYDLSNVGSRLSNFSSRTQLAAADNSVIAGFTVPPGSGTRRFLLRAVGTGRGFSGVGALKDPKLEIFGARRKSRRTTIGQTPTDRTTTILPR